MTALTPAQVRDHARALLKCERCGKRGVRRPCGNVTCADCPCWCWGGEAPDGRGITVTWTEESADATP